VGVGPKPGAVTLPLTVLPENFTPAGTFTVKSTLTSLLSTDWPWPSSQLLTWRRDG
jgi:hypothetical protein